MSFAAQHGIKKDIVFYIEQDFPETGDSAFYFVQIDEPKISKFLKLMDGESSEAFNLNDFGRIIESGYGKPSDTLISTMRDAYQLEYTF